MREGDDDAQAGAHEPEQLGLGLADAAAGERRPLRLEGRVALAAGRARVTPSSRSTTRRLAHVGALAGRARVARRGLGQAVARRLEHAIGLPGADARRGRSARAPARRGRSGPGTSSSCVHSSTSAGARRASRAGCRSQRSSSASERCVKTEKREMRSTSSPNSSMRTGSAPGRREDVEDVAAHRQLAAVADALDARVARRHERGDGLVAHELAAALDVQGRGPALARRDALDQRGRRDRHQPAGLEQPEPARALADEVRRRLEPRAVGDAARRARSRPRPPARTRPPRRPPRARVSSSSHEHGQAGALLAAAPLPERRQERRERRLGHARARRQRRVERARELCDTGLCGDLVRDGREVGEVQFEGVAVHGFGRHGAGACRIASGS